jgi:hypothetical protein
MTRAALKQAINDGVRAGVIQVAVQAAATKAFAAQQAEINRTADALARHPKVKAAVSARLVEARRKQLNPAGLNASAETSALLRDALAGGR